MYDWPEIRTEVDAEWVAIRARLKAAGIEAPRHLVRRNADLPPVPGGIRGQDGQMVAPDPATLPPQILKLSEKYLRNPVRVEVGEANKAADRIEQKTVRVNHEAKYDQLLHELKERAGTVIVFVKSKYGTEKLAAKLRKSGHTADAIHGDLEQRKRERVLEAFRNKHHRVLVATDIASRGLDIPHIEHVINYDLPQAPEDYIHRIGRTGRAGADGAAVSFIAPEDGLKWRAIQKLMNPDATPDPLPEGSAAPKKKRRRGGRGRSGGEGRSEGAPRQGSGRASSSAPRAEAPRHRAPREQSRPAAPRAEASAAPAPAQGDGHGKSLAGLLRAI